jgi:hypothetical protein
MRRADSPPVRRMHQREMIAPNNGAIGTNDASAGDANRPE